MKFYILSFKSIKEKKLLSIDDYILQTSLCDKAQNKLTGFVKQPDQLVASSFQIFLNFTTHIQIFFKLYLK
jgi:hypothetical protein